MQLLVLGMHRSGTSVVTRIINLMGAYFGPQELALPSNSANPKGFWERKDVMLANNALLTHQHCRWDKVDMWLDRKCDSLPVELTTPIRDIIAGLDAHKPWVVKDPRLCVVLPCWLPMLSKPVAVICSRHPWESARSLQLRNGISMEDGLALWEYHALATIRNAHKLPKIFVCHDDMMANPVATVMQLFVDLESHHVSGLNMPSPAVIRDFVDGDLHRAKKPKDLPPLSAHHEKIYQTLRGELEFDTSMLVSPQSLQAMRSRPL